VVQPPKPKPRKVRRARPRTPLRPRSRKKSSPPTAEVPSWFAPLLAKARLRARRRADVLRTEHPAEDPRALGERLVRSQANRAGIAAGVTATLALVTLPVGLPAGMAIALFFEAELLLALLALYGLDTGGDRGTLRLYALWAGAGFADAAKSAGLRAGAKVVGRAIAGSLPARIIARLNPILLRAILRRLGLGWLPRALRMWPLLGAPIGFAMDRAALRTLGVAALDTLDEATKRRTP
jgi:hypothetical protein